MYSRKWKDYPIDTIIEVGGVSPYDCWYLIIKDGYFLESVGYKKDYKSLKDVNWSQNQHKISPLYDDWLESMTIKNTYNSWVTKTPLYKAIYGEK